MTSVAVTTTRTRSSAQPRLDECGPIDRAHLARYTLGNVELELEVLELFADQARTCAAALQTPMTTADWRSTTHTLKGSALAVGAWDVAERAQDAEAACEAGPEIRSAILSKLDSVVDVACRHIDRLVATR